jgi:hypothetical protein
MRATNKDASRHAIYNSAEDKLEDELVMNKCPGFYPHHILRGHSSWSFSSKKRERGENQKQICNRVKTDILHNLASFSPNPENNVYDLKSHDIFISETLLLRPPPPPYPPISIWPGLLRLNHHQADDGKILFYLQPSLFCSLTSCYFLKSKKGTSKRYICMQMANGMMDQDEPKGYLHSSSTHQR